VKVTLNARNRSSRRVTGIDILCALGIEVHANFKIRDNLRAGFLGDLRRIADMIVVAMRDHNMGCARSGFVYAAWKFRVAGEKGIDENDGIRQLKAEGRVAELDKVHARLPDGLRRAGRIRDIYGLRKYTKRS
jgi:hypothetical protein